MWIFSRSLQNNINLVDYISLAIHTIITNKVGVLHGMDCQVQVRNCPCLSLCLQTIHAFDDTKFHGKQVKGLFLGPREGYEWISATLSLDYSIRLQIEFCATLKNKNSMLRRLYHLQYDIMDELPFPRPSRFYMACTRVSGIARGQTL